MENETTELIDQYLLGQLDTPTRQAVEARIQTDAPFADEVALQRAIIRQARQLGREALRGQLKAIAANAQTPDSDRDSVSNAPDETPVIPLRPVRSLWAYLSVAASVFLLLGIWFWNTRASEPAGVVAQVESPTLVTVPLIRSGNEPAMGFANGNDTTEITILLYPGPATGQYRFDDTLRLYGSFDPARLRVLTNADSATYRLQIGPDAFPLKRYQPKQPLVR